MSVRSQLGLLRGHLLTTLHRRSQPLGDLGPIVTFTFDDFPRTACTEGARLLDAFHAPATFYVAMGLINQETRIGPQFRIQDLESVLARGHEIALHGYNHISARKASRKAFLADIMRGEMMLAERFPDGVSNNFAYPYGEATLFTKRTLGPRFTSSRGTLPGFNGPDVDLNLLRANPLYGDISTLARVRDLINTAVRSGLWLIFYSHDVCHRPSPFGCTPSLLTMAVSFALERGARVLTVAEVVKTLGARP